MASIFRGRGFPATRIAADDRGGFDLHYALGHAHEGILRATAKDMSTKVTGTLGFCGGCASAKGIKTSVPKSTECKAKRPLERLFADLTGPKTPSVGGSRYCLMIVDDYSGMG